MSVIPEELLLGFLDSCLSLGKRALDEIRLHGSSSPASSALVEDYAKLIERIHREKRRDTILADESWEWIWKVKPELNPVQIYGRLAWLNFSLVELL